MATPLLRPPLFGPAKSHLISCIKTFLIRPPRNTTKGQIFRSPCAYFLCNFTQHCGYKLGDRLNIANNWHMYNDSDYDCFHKQVFIVLTNLRRSSNLLVNWFSLPLVLVQSLLLYIYNDPTITPYHGQLFLARTSVRDNGVPLYFHSHDSHSRCNILVRNVAGYKFKTKGR